MKKIFLLVIMILTLTTTVTAYNIFELPNNNNHFRIVGEDSEERLIVANDTYTLNFYSPELEILNTVNTGTYPAEKILDYGIPIYNDSNALAFMYNNTHIGIATDSGDITSHLINIEEYFYDFSDTAPIQSRLLGITESYYLISTAWGNSVYFHAVLKTDLSDYVENNYFANEGNPANFEDLRLSAIDMTFPISSSSIYGGSLIPYYDNGKIYNYIYSSYYTKLYPYYYDNDAINTRILSEGNSLGVGARLKLFYNVRIDDGKYYTASEAWNTDYQLINRFRTVEIDITKNTFTTDRYYTYINKSGEEVEIELGGYDENGIYRLTHDNKGNIIFTINDIEPENFEYEITCERYFCAFGNFGFIGDNIAWLDESDNTLYIITDAPTIDQNPEIRVFGNIYAPQYNEVLSQLSRNEPDRLILKNDSDTITYPYDYTDGDYTINVDKINKELPIYVDENGIYETAQNETKFIIQTFDLTNDEVNIAYECDQEEISGLSDSDDYSDEYVIVAEKYNSSDGEECSFTIIEEPDTSFMNNYVENAHYLFYNNDCVGNTTFTTSATGTTENVYYTDVMIGEGKGVTYTFNDRYGEQIFNFTVQHVVTNTTTQYAYIEVDGELEYNTTALNELVNKNMEIILSFEDGKVYYNIDGRVISEITKDYTLPIRSINIEQKNKTGTYAGYPDYNTIGAWAIYNDGVYPEQNSGVTEITYEDGYRYYEIVCDYTNNPNEEQKLRIYYDDNNIDYKRYKDVYVTFNLGLEEYELVQTATGKLIDEERESLRTEQTYNMYCNAINICSDTDRLSFAVVTIIVLTFLSILAVRVNFEDGTAMTVIPTAVFTLAFIYFAIISFLPTWMIVLFIVSIAGILAVTFNPSNYFGGNRGF